MGWCCGGWGGWGAWGSGWGILGILGLVLNLLLFLGLLALLGLGIAWLVRQMGRRPAAPGGPDPLEIARRRLAAGEITLAEFEEIRDRLRS
jgi:uncharacterized membrane protein